MAGAAPALGLVESPAQLLNAMEWAYAEAAAAHLVVLAPTDPVTRFQLHRLTELARASGFHVEWAEVRAGARSAAALNRVARRVRSSPTVVLGDPYSGMAHLLLNIAPAEVRLVVVDDGTATLRYAEQWASGAELRRWHLARRGLPARVVGGRAARLLGGRSDRVRLFTAMPVDTELPMGRNTYAWVRNRFGAPEILPGTDLLGSSLVETGVVDASAYLAGVARLVAEDALARYLPHRHESREKLAAIAAMGLEVVRPDLPMEVYARRGPIGRAVWSFPSTVLHTLPLVLTGTPVTVKPLAVADAWFSADARGEEKAFVQGIAAEPGPRPPTG